MSNSSANNARWFTYVLLVVLSLAAGGGAVWFFKDRFAPRPHEDDGPEDVDQVRSLLGTLSLTAARDTVLAGDYWIYVNGRIIASKTAAAASGPYSQTGTAQGAEWRDGRGQLIATRTSGVLAPTRAGKPSTEKHEILLVPGEYKVEVGLSRHFLDAAGTISDAVFPLVFRSYQVKIEAGKTAELRVNVGAEVYERFAGPESSLLSALYYQSGTYETLRDEANGALKNYQLDPTFVALNDVFVALQQAPPLTPLVYVNLPADQGGGREFDAAQVRLLVDWLKAKHYGRFLRRPTRGVPYPSSPYQKQLRLQVEQIEQTVALWRNAVDRLKDLSAKLDAVPK